MEINRKMVEAVMKTFKRAYVHLNNLENAGMVWRSCPTRSIVTTRSTYNFLKKRSSRGYKRVSTTSCERPF